MSSMPGQLNPSYKHGHSMRHKRSSEYESWNKMHSRCKDPKNNRYASHGARGITVCGRWQYFEAFIEDMGLKPSPSHSIDRIDNDGNYEPLNCRWATPKEQNNNRRDNVVLEIGGRRKTMTQWSNETGIRVGTIWWRLRAGWNPTDAVLKPARRRA